MRYLLPLLLLSLPAGASCFTHPDTGVIYCTSPQDCPAGTGAVEQGRQWVCVNPPTTTVSCAPPLMWNGNTCVPAVCEITIRYGVRIEPEVLLTPGCTPGPASMALAATIQRILKDTP